ncbi:MAG: 1-acyl-sn-glycerol-3-phosphate acyltransferase [Deltaproteobacteria bacterium]|nr:1-acyl-sn-glycerol-3-phosphate acyltransferase [Deltaproteobacteria bacterium]
MKWTGIDRALVTYGWTAWASALALMGQLLGENEEDLARHILRWARVLEWFWGIEVEVTGLEHYLRGERLVLIANHQSYVDVVALFLVLPEIPVFLAKQELGRLPLFGEVMRRRGDIFIDRQHHTQATEAIAQAARQLRAGSPLLVFPEGTRARRPEIGHFKKGAFHLAKQAGAAIQPIGIVGSLEAWPRDAWAPRGGKVQVRIGPAISAKEVAEQPIDELLHRSRRIIASLTGLPCKMSSSELVKD